MSAPSRAARAALERRQLERLDALVRRLARDNPFYAPRLQAAGLADGVESLAAFRARVPFTTKDELARDQREHPPYGTNRTSPLARYVRLHQTSSTTGAPLRWLDTAAGWEWMRGAWRAIWRAAGVGAGDRLVCAFSFGPFIGFWLGFEAAAQLGCLAIPAGPLDSRARAALLRDHAATALCCTPTYALHLGEVAREQGIDAAALPLRTLVVAGEPGGLVPGTRARLEALWPTATVCDHHGLTEVGPVTFQARDDPRHAQVLETHHLCELVDPETGAPLPPDHDGLAELVLTSLGRGDAPVLRYRTGDLVRPAGHAPGARPFLLLEGGVRARADQMVCVRGVNVYPSAVDDAVRAVDGVLEYRVVVDRRGALVELALEVEPDPALPDPEAPCRRIAEELRARLALRVPVTPAPAPLPRFELKARRWVER